jgi:hypothetical protein
MLDFTRGTRVVTLSKAQLNNLKEKSKELNHQSRVARILAKKFNKPGFKKRERMARQLDEDIKHHLGLYLDPLIFDGRVEKGSDDYEVALNYNQ